MPPQMIQGMEKMVPPQPPRNIGAIADTYFSLKPGGGIPSLTETGQAIPFFGILMGLACIGHSVCVFEGTEDSLTAGCKDVDLLVDCLAAEDPLLARVAHEQLEEVTGKKIPFDAAAPADQRLAKLETYRAAKGK